MDPSSRIAAFAVPRLDGSIAHALQDIAAQCARLRERRAVCLRIHVRLEQVWRLELRDAASRASALQRVVPVLGRFADVLVRVRDTLARFLDDDDPMFRLMMSRQLAVRLHRAHCDISAVELELMLLSDRAHAEAVLELLALVDVQWRADQRVQELLDKQRSGYAAPLQRELQSIDAELLVLSDACASASLRSRNSELPTPALLLLSVGWDTDTRLTLTGWHVRLCDDDEDASASDEDAIACGSSLTPRRLAEQVSAATQEPSEQQMLDRSESQRALAATASIVYIHRACHLCRPVALAIPTSTLATGTSSTRRLAQLLASHSDELLRLFESTALRLHVDHESELMCTSSGTAPLVSALGVEILATHDCD